MWNLNNISSPEDLASLHSNARNFAAVSIHKYYRIVVQLDEHSTGKLKVLQAIVLKSLAIESLQSMIDQGLAHNDFLSTKLSEAQAELNKLEEDLSAYSDLERQILIFEMNLQRLRAETFLAFLAEMNIPDPDQLSIRSNRPPAVDLSGLSAEEKEEFVKYFLNACHQAYGYYYVFMSKMQIIRERTGRYDAELGKTEARIEIDEYCLNFRKTMEEPEQYASFARSINADKATLLRYTLYKKAYNPIRGEFMAAKAEMFSRLRKLLKELAKEHGIETGDYWA